MKTIPSHRSVILASTLLAAFTSSSAHSQTVKLADYFYPAQEGASWSYKGTGWGGYEATERVTIANTDWSLKMFTGKKSPKSYSKNVLRFKFEREYGGSDLWYEYFGKGSAYSYYGMDDEGEHVRLDGGLVFPSSVSVGKTYSPRADYYDAGRYRGEITYSLQVVDTQPVTVPAGRFPDCVHLLFKLKQGNQVFQTNEMWWAKGLGVIKKKDVNEEGETRWQELVSSSIKTGPEISIQQPKGSNLTDGTTKRRFGTVSIGKSSPLKTFTITNTGTTKLTNLGARTYGPHSGDFIITGPHKNTLEPADSTVFNIRFKPTARGTRSASLIISSNDPDENPFNINIIGIGVAR